MLRKRVAPDIAAEFAIVDVKRGRKALAKLVEDRGLKIPIVLRGHIIGTCSNDDGESIEFEIDVTSIATSPPVDSK